MGDRCFSAGNTTDPQNKQFAIITLPNEILFRIFSLLPKDEVFWNLGLTCQKLFVITCDILEHEIFLGGESSSQEVYDMRLKELQRYKEVKELVGYFFFAGGDSYRFKDNLDIVKEKSSSERSNDLIVVYKKCIMISEAEKIFDGLRKFTQLKGLFIFRDTTYLDNPLIPPNEIPSLGSISKQICDYMSTSNKKDLKRLCLIGFEDDQICEVIEKVYSNSLEYLDISQCRFSRNAVLKLLENCQNLTHAVLFNIPELKGSDIEHNLSHKVRSIDYGLISPYWKNRAFNLREKFCKYGRCSKGAIADQITNGPMDSIVNAPEPLLALFMVAREWHSIR